MFQATSALALASRLTLAWISSGVVYYDGAIKVYIEGGKIVLNVDKRPFSTGYAALWVPKAEDPGWPDRTVARLVLQFRMVRPEVTADQTPKKQ